MHTSFLFYSSMNNLILKQSQSDLLKYYKTKLEKSHNEYNLSNIDFRSVHFYDFAFNWVTHPHPQDSCNVSLTLRPLFNKR